MMTAGGRRNMQQEIINCTLMSTVCEYVDFINEKCRFIQKNQKFSKFFCSTTNYSVNINYAPNCRPTRIFFQYSGVRMFYAFPILAVTSVRCGYASVHFFDSPCMFSLHGMYNVKILFVNQIIIRCCKAETTDSVFS